MIRIAPPSPERAEELYDVVAKVFSTDGYFGFLRFCRDAYFAGSSYDWGVSRVVEAGGRIVAHVGVWEYRMRVGCGRLRTGGIGAVATHADYRNRRYASKLCRAVVDAMRRAGYDFSVLFGRRDFYDRFGYVPAWPVTSLKADVAALPHEKLRFSLRKVPLTEVLCGRGPVMRIYNRDNATRTGTAERPIYTGSGGLWLGSECRTLNDARGKVRGYLVTQGSGEELAVQEVGGLAAPCGVRQLLSAIRRIALRAGRKRIRTHGISYSHPLCTELRRGNCAVELVHLRSGGPMALVVDLRSCLSAMAGELTARLRSAGLRKYKGALTVQGAGEKVSLRISAGRVAVAPGAVKTPNLIRAGPAVARLVIGSEGPSLLAEQSDIRCRGGAADLAEALFPQQWPMLGAIDHF